MTYTNNLDIASLFNDYFCSIGPDYDSKIPSSPIDPCCFINTNHSSSFFLEPVSPIEIGHHIRNLKNSKQELNHVTTPILKENYEIISFIFADLINACFQAGKFPKIL